MTLNRLPNRRGLHHLKNGLIDGAFICSYTSERNSYAIYPVCEDQTNNDAALAKLSYFLYKKNDSSIDWDSKNFNGSNLIIAVSAGVSVINVLKHHQVKIIQVSANESLLNSLKSDRVSGIVMQETKADDYFAQRDFDIVKVYPPVLIKDYYLVVNLIEKIVLWLIKYGKKLLELKNNS